MNARNTVAWKPQNYESRVASVRIRCLSTLRHLRAERYPVELYRERHESAYRTVLFSKAYNSKDVALAERLKQQGVHILFDLCDNHFLLSGERVARLKRMFALADHWVVSSDALARVVRDELGEATPLTVIEDAVEDRLSGFPLDLAGWVRGQAQLRQLDRFLNEPAHRQAAHLVWFGNHKASHKDSGLVHLGRIRSLLERANRSHPLTLTVISNSREAYSETLRDWAIPGFYIDWNAHTFFKAMRRHSITVIPIGVNEFTAVKTNNRIALSLNLGLGVVADAIDSYRVFADCAFLDRWEEGLTAYLERPELISRHVRSAREIIRQRFIVPVIAERWKALFELV